MVIRNNGGTVNIWAWPAGPWLAIVSRPGRMEETGTTGRWTWEQGQVNNLTLTVYPDGISINGGMRGYDDHQK